LNKALVYTFRLLHLKVLSLVILHFLIVLGRWLIVQTQKMQVKTYNMHNILALNTYS